MTKQTFHYSAPGAVRCTDKTSLPLSARTGDADFAARLRTDSDLAAFLTAVHRFNVLPVTTQSGQALEVADAVATHQDHVTSEVSDGWTSLTYCCTQCA